LFLPFYDFVLLYNKDILSSQLNQVVEESVFFLAVEREKN